MCGGGGSQTTTQQTTIPPEVLARYNSVNARAEGLASTPFQRYSNDPNAFVAPLTQTQQAGIAGTNQFAQAAQPYYGAATEQLMGAQQAGAAGLSGAYMPLQQGMGAGQQLGAEAYGAYAGLPATFAPSMMQAQRSLQQGVRQGQQGLGAAQQFALAGAQGISPQQFSGQAVGQYMSPFLSNVVGQTMAAQAQQNAQQRRALTGEAIKAGAFGGDRSGIAQANLAYQQNLANQQTIANLLQGGYGQALGAFQQQQGVNLAAEQANRAALQQTGQTLAGLGQQAFGMGTGAAQQQAALGQTLAGLQGQQAQGLAGLGQQQFGQGVAASQQLGQLAQQGYGMGSATAQQLANLGTGAQAAGLQGAQAQMAAGQMQQQTEQAGLQALYNQFLQEKSYPFQVAQFLANIAMGTGSLSGSTTTTTQPAPFFSDERLKDNIQPIGKTFDGQDIVKFNYKGSPNKQIGLLAQDVEKKHPEAVGLAGGFKTVDYDAATEKAASEGRDKKALGGSAAFDQDFIKQILANQAGMYSGLYGQAGTPRGAQGLPGQPASRVPAATLPVGKLTSHSAPQRQSSGMDDLKQAAALGDTAANLFKKGKEFYKENLAEKPKPQQPGLAAGTKTTESPAAATGAVEAGKKVAEAGDKLDLEATQDAAKSLVASAEDVIKDTDAVEDFASLFAARGGRIKLATGGTPGSDDDSDPDYGAPEGMYKPEGAGIDIPNETRKNELQKHDKPAKTDSGFGDLMDAVGTAAKIASVVIPFFSDKRLKENVKTIGKTKDGQDIVRFNYKGSDQTHIGLIAQDVEKKHPEAVGVAGGFKTVNYDKATKSSERSKKAVGGPAEDVKEGLGALTGEVLPPEREEEKKGVAPVRLAARSDTATDAAPAGVAPAAQPSLFERSVKRTYDFEVDKSRKDGHINYRDTNGTPSVYGVNQMANPDVDVKNLTWDEAKKIYKTRYWDAIGADNMDPKLAHVAYDTAVLAGPARAKKMVAQADGDPVKFMEIRQDFLNGLLAKDPKKYGKYAPAWADRNATLMNDITEGNVLAAAVPGTAGSGRGSVDVAAAPYSAIMGGLLPEGTSQKTRDVLTSENFWVPLLAGVGSMLASPSVKLPGAIGAGLVGGTAAYTGLKKQQADVAATQAGTEKTYADLARESIFTDQGGRTWFRYLLPGGGYGVMSIAEWLGLPDNAKPKLDPRIEKIVLDVAAKEKARTGAGAAAGAPAGVAPAIGAPAPGKVETKPLDDLPAEAPAGAGGQGTQPSATGAPAGATQPSTTAAPSGAVIALPSELQQKYQTVGKQLMAGGDQMAGQMPDVFTPQMNLAKGANDQRPQLTELAVSLAASPRTGMLASGAAQKQLQPVAFILNGYASALGIPPVIDPKDVAKAEAVEKAAGMLKTAAAKASGQTAFASLDQFAATLPSKITSPAGQAELLAQLYYINQREIDKNEFYNQVRRAASGDKGQYAQYAMRSGLEADQDFNKTYSQKFYANEIKSLQRMFNEGPKGMKTADGRPISYMEFLNKEGSSLSTKERQAIENIYGRGILRYFGI